MYIPFLKYMSCHINISFAVGFQVLYILDEAIKQFETYTSIPGMLNGQCIYKFVLFLNVED